MISNGTNILSSHLLQIFLICHLLWWFGFATIGGGIFMLFPPFIWLFLFSLTAQFLRLGVTRGMAFRWPAWNPFSRGMCGGVLLSSSGYFFHLRFHFYGGFGWWWLCWHQLDMCSRLLVLLVHVSELKLHSRFLFTLSFLWDYIWLLLASCLALLLTVVMRRLCNLCPCLVVTGPSQTRKRSCSKKNKDFFTNLK